jgi:hypothetical protein
MIEHMTAGGHDGALAGDLLEEHRAGRSDAWYWRQTIAACVVSWLTSLQARASLLVFTMLWCLMAPVWKTLCDRILAAPILERIWHLAGGVWVLPALALWIVLHATFLWTGILVFSAVCAPFGKTVPRECFRRALLLAPLIFTPIYAITLVLGSLYWYSVFAPYALAATPLGQMTDLRLLADVMRIPYFIAMLAALWGAFPRSMRALQPLWPESPEVESLTQSNSGASNTDPLTLNRFLVFLVCAGLINAMIMGFLLSHLPESPSPTVASLLLRAVGYVAAGALAGVAGTWVYWMSPASLFREHAPIPFPLFALICAVGWVWVPSMVMYWHQISAATSFVAAIGAFVLVAGLRKVTSSGSSGALRRFPTSQPLGAELFSESLLQPSVEASGYAIATCIYAAGVALFNHCNYAAAAFLASSAALFAWKRTIPGGPSLDWGREYKRAALRLAAVAIPVVLVTFWALLEGVAQRNHATDMNSALAVADRASQDGDSNEKPAHTVPASGISGYESIILWPVPEKKQIVPPLPAETSFLAPGTTRPLVIRFDAPYWYFQPPAKRPGPRAYQAQGTPLLADIQANNFLPLIMEAHQTLGSSIRVDRCREVKVSILNSDNRRGVINLAVLLTDTSSPAKPSLYLGQQPVVTSQPGQFAVKSSPKTEALRFLVPAQAKIRKFDEITVMFLPDQGNFDLGPKIAIQDFELQPR